MEVTNVWLTDDAVWIKTADGREEKELFADYARLKNAPREALEDYYVSEFGIHWKILNEDLAFECFFMKKPKSPLYKLFLSHPEINVSALARRLGISQSLMAQYVGGAKKPSAERMQAIVNEIRKIGAELTVATI